ncbi:MAG: P-loop NTPase fold protein [Candidatus Poribacteria bacterium]|nr:P-loop NTPase fold protein [Candidatus Poribacteria bacterium]
MVIFSRSGKKADYQNDRALDSAKHDAFKHTHYVEVLKDILCQSNTPLNIGLYGRWGVGKSSILHMLKEVLAKRPLSSRFRYVEVDAWGFSAKSLQQDILVDLNNQLRAFPKNKMADMLFNERTEAGRTIRQIPPKYWYMFLAVMAGIGIGTWTVIDHMMWEFVVPLNLAGYTIILATFVRVIMLIINSSTTTVPRPISPFQFSEIYEKMVKKQKNKTLVVAIDNIDRCDDKVAVDLLGIIQTFMAKSHCVNILACDNEAITKHLRNVNEQYTDSECNEFLSKFFQVTIRIPPFIGENLDSYAQKLLKKRRIRFDPFVKQVLISGAVKNPRKINQFLNNITALYRLAEHKEKDGRLRKGSVTGHTDILAKIVVLQHEWPEFYKALEKEPKLLSDKGMEWKNNELLNNNESADDLRDFLNATRVCFTNDLSPFLRLNQESYQADIPEIEQFELDVNANVSVNLICAV